MGDKIRLAVIDDHPLMRQGIEQTLGGESDFEVLEGGSSAEDALRIANQETPHIMLLDVNMPGGGLAAARQIGAVQPKVRTLMLTVSELHDHVAEALEAGVRGYILKGISGSDFVRTIRTVVAGETYITPDFAARLLSLSNAKKKVDLDDGVLTHPLSSREEEVLKALSMGATNKEIAIKLNLTEQTIKHYISRILLKFKARNRVEAVVAYKRLSDKT